jgi:hypothetical protein
MMYGTPAGGRTYIYQTQQQQNPYYKYSQSGWCGNQQLQELYYYLHFIQKYSHKKTSNIERTHTSAPANNKQRILTDCCPVIAYYYTHPRLDDCEETITQCKYQKKLCGEESSANSDQHGKAGRRRKRSLLVWVKQIE